MPSKEKKKKKKKGRELPLDPNAVIEFDHVTKRYKLHGRERKKVLGLFEVSRRTLLGETLANDDLSFSVKKGEAVALVGNNGAGKSTALKMVTGVTKPTKGKVRVRGRVSALLELNAGFDNQLTGRENLKLRSQVLGIPRKEYEAMEQEIIEFANLGLYIDQPLKTYSSGMRSRLGFALAASIDPDILVVDEALSVGDRRFKKKCLRRMQEIMERDDVTVLFVTHESKAAKELCTRGIVLDHGQLLFDGDIDDAIDFYDEMCEAEGEEDAPGNPTMTDEERQRLKMRNRLAKQRRKQRSMKRQIRQQKKQLEEQRKELEEQRRMLDDEHADADESVMAQAAQAEKPAEAAQGLHDAEASSSQAPAVEQPAGQE